MMDRQLLQNKAEYIIWAATQWGRAERSCPACDSSDTKLIKRKYWVTALYRCGQCELMFRVPKNAEQQARSFYQKQYRQGFTTACPNDKELTRLIQTSFRGTEKDYTTYIEVIKAAGLRHGDIVFDFGCSWGYGSWQFAEAGFRVYSYEISFSRARYAAEKLGCQMLSQTDQIPEKADCFFSAHVIEHLPNPRILWEKAASVLKPNGFVVLFMPNGEPSRAATDANYHKLWGHVHPLLLSADALRIMALQNGFVGYSYSSPYKLSKISHGEPDQLLGEELLCLARRTRNNSAEKGVEHIT